MKKEFKPNTSQTEMDVIYNGPGNYSGKILTVTQSVALDKYYITTDNSMNSYQVGGRIFKKDLCTVIPNTTRNICLTKI